MSCTALVSGLRNQPLPARSLHGANVSFPVNDRIESPPMGGRFQPEEQITLEAASEPGPADAGREKPYVPGELELCLIRHRPVAPALDAVLGGRAAGAATRDGDGQDGSRPLIPHIRPPSSRSDTSRYSRSFTCAAR